ncbi:MAG: flap endonuclease-1 [Nanoarchaeota archaeon]|nr:MAG: flap endonuclease-1 [Nanoarchaeota archaeon]
MGVSITEILPVHSIEFEDLANKVVVIDGFLVLYQFLATIRQPDGTPLKDSHGRITSHLQGLFARSVNLMQKGVKLAFVFDGTAPALKKRVQESRSKAKTAAKEAYDDALKQENIELMQKYAGRTSRLTPEMVTEAKRLLDALGLPWIQAPSEGEAQAAAIVADGKAYAVGTQDADAFLFGAPRLIKNLTVSEKKKAPNKLSYISVKPELIELNELLSKNEITQDQLIAIGILVGTDYNPGGVKGIGVKKALKLIKEHSNLSDVFNSVSWNEKNDIKWEEIFNTIRNIPVTRDYSLKWGKPSEEKIIKILCEEHDFSFERVKSAIDKLKNVSQQGLGQWV